MRTSPKRLHICMHSVIVAHLICQIATAPAPAVCAASEAVSYCYSFDGSEKFVGGGLSAIVGEEGQLQPQGDLSTQFGLGHTASAAFTMTSSVEPSHASFSSTKPLPEFEIDYGHDVVAHDTEEREISLVFDGRGGARWRTNVQFDSGTFSVRIKTPDGDTSGLNTSFYLSSLEGDKAQDEIDFEFLGKDKGIVQTNYYTIGTGNREEIHPLGFDSSSEFHDYTIRWLPGKIEWLIDGKLVRTAEKKDGEAWPEKPMYLYASIWNAGYIDEGRWAGSYSGAHEPYVSKYRDVHVPVNHSGSTTNT